MSMSPQPTKRTKVGKPRSTAENPRGTRGKKTSATPRKSTASGSKPVKKRNHPKYGTSKLEDKFAKEFLDRLGVPYERQFEAKDIGRFYDFKIGDRVLAEIDGDFYHGYGLTFEEKSPMQKRNERVDEYKNKWAREHGYILIRIWEHDIHDHPSEVMRELRKVLDIDDKNKDKKRRH